MNLDQIASSLPLPMLNDQLASSVTSMSCMPPMSMPPINPTTAAGMSAAVRTATDDIKLVGSVLKHALTTQLQGRSSEWTSQGIQWDF